MTETKAYTRCQYVHAVNVSGLVASTILLLLSLPDAGWNIVGAAPFVYGFGLIIAWVTIGPALYFLMKHSIGWARALLWGFGLGAAISALSFLLGQRHRRKAAEDDSFNYTLGGGDFVRDFDGVLTDYGWQQLILAHAIFIATCTLTALIVRYLIGPGKASTS